MNDCRVCDGIVRNNASAIVQDLDSERPGAIIRTLYTARDEPAPPSSWGRQTAKVVAQQRRFTEGR
jgi:hypothetical protein